MIQIKKIGLFLFLAMLFLQTKAQDELMPRMAIGGQVGYHLSFMEFAGGEPVRWDYFQGMTGGVNLQFMSRKMLGFETSILYGQFGWYEDNNLLQPVGKKVVHRIEIPLYSHISIGKRRLRLLLDAGPYFRFRIKEETEGVLFKGTVFENRSLDNGTSYGLSFQGGFAWRSPSLIVQLRGNFHMGLTNFFEPIRSELEVSAERSTGGSISVMIPFGNKYIDE